MFIPQDLRIAANRAAKRIAMIPDIRDTVTETTTVLDSIDKRLSVLTALCADINSRLEVLEKRPNKIHL